MGEGDLFVPHEQYTGFRLKNQVLSFHNGWLGHMNDVRTFSNNIK